MQLFHLTKTEYAKVHVQMVLWLYKILVRHVLHHAVLAILHKHHALLAQLDTFMEHNVLVSVQMVQYSKMENALLVILIVHFALQLSRISVCYVKLD